MQDEGPPACTTLYNGACPVCRPEVEHYARLDAKAGNGNRFVNLYEADAILARHGLDKVEVKKRLHMIGPDGRLYVGVDAFLRIWSAIPCYRWLARFVGSRPVRPVAVFVYDRALAPLLYAHNKRRERREARG